MYGKLIEKMRCCSDQYRCGDCRFVEDCAGEKYLLDEAADAIERLQAFNAMWQGAAEMAHEREPKWIPVAERLPEQDQDVLVMVHWRDYPEDMMCYGRRFKTKWYLWNGELGELLKGFDITHWMPLPEPPKEE